MERNGKRTATAFTHQVRFLIDHRSVYTPTPSHLQCSWLSRCAFTIGRRPAPCSCMCSRLLGRAIIADGSEQVFKLQAPCGAVAHNTQEGGSVCIYTVLPMFAICIRNLTTCYRTTYYALRIYSHYDGAVYIYI